MGRLAVMRVSAPSRVRPPSTRRKAVHFGAKVYYTP